MKGLNNLLEISFVNTGNPHALLFIHGLIGSKATWKNSNGQFLPDMLLKDTTISTFFDCAFIEYTSKRMDSAENLEIKLLGKLLKSVIESNCHKYDTVSIVAHSMGGLITKAAILEMLKENGSSRISLFISLAVPHNGSNYATFIQLFPINKQAKALDPLNELIVAMNTEWIDKNTARPKTVYFVATKDTVVPNTSALGYHPDARKSVYCLADHFEIAKPKTFQTDSYLSIKHELLEYTANFHTLLKNPQGDKNIIVAAVNILDDKHKIEEFRKAWDNDASVSDKGAFPIIDAKLVNHSNLALFLTKLEFRISIKNVLLETERLSSPVPVSWEYNMLINSADNLDLLTGMEITKYIDISQVIHPNEVDRFIVTIGCIRDGNFESIDCQVHIVLHYNNNQQVYLGLHNINLEPPRLFTPGEPVDITIKATSTV